MTLIATIGATDANSYVTLAEAEEYILDRIHSSAWVAYTDKEQALVSASRMLDWYVKFKGIRTTAEQSMQWPRIQVTRPDGRTVDGNVIPNEVKTAVYELALSSLSADRMEDDPLGGISTLKAGTLMIKAGPAPPNSTNTKVVPEKIRKILREVMTNNGSCVVRLIRG
jgi:hypothetical protein